MAFPIGLAIAGAGLAGKIFGRGRKLSDDPEVRKALAEYERLASEAGSEAEVEQQFRPAREQIRRRITALGPPGASGAVSGAFAELEGQKAAVKAGLQRQARERLANLRVSLAGKRGPSFLGGLEDDLVGIGTAIAFPPKLGTEAQAATGTRSLGRTTPISPLYGDEGVGTDFMLRRGLPGYRTSGANRRRFSLRGIY